MPTSSSWWHGGATRDDRVGIMTTVIFQWRYITVKLIVESPLWVPISSCMFYHQSVCSHHANPPKSPSFQSKSDKLLHFSNDCWMNVFSGVLNVTFNTSTPLNTFVTTRSAKKYLRVYWIVQDVLLEICYLFRVKQWIIKTLRSQLKQTFFIKLMVNVERSH